MLIMFGRLFPFFVSIIIFAGFSLAFIVRRSDFAIRGLGIIIPTILASYILIKLRKRKNNFEDIYLLFSVDNIKLVLLFCIFYVITISIILINPNRPVYYFIIISILNILVFIKIFSKTVKTNLILLYDLELSKQNRCLRAYLVKYIEKVILYLSNKIIVISDGVKMQIPEHQNKCLTLPNGVDIERIRNTNYESTIKTPAEKKIIGFILGFFAISLYLKFEENCQERGYEIIA